VTLIDQSQQELTDSLRPYFANVVILSTTSRDQLEERENVYFFASDEQNCL